MKNSIEQHGVDVDRKILTLFIFAFICAVLLIISVTLAVSFASGLRGYVGGEGHWTKAQKESVIHLSHYISTEEEEDFNNFKRVFRVIMGDRMGREELKKQDYDYDVAFEAYRQGLNHPDDIPHMIRIFNLFQNFGPVKQAIEVWETGDDKIDELISFGETIHREIQKGDISQQQKEVWLDELIRLDHELTDLELRFSDSMDSMARSVNQVVKWTTIVLGLFIITIGVWLTTRFYNSTNIWTATLQETEEKFRNVLDNSRDVLFKMNVNTQKYEYVSPALETMLGYDTNEFSEGGIKFIMSKMHPEDKERIQKVVDRYESVEDREFLSTLEYRLKDSDGNWKWVSNTRTMVRNGNGEPEAIVGTVRDISYRKEQEEKIRKSLQEKEVLLKEIHHRVKNNLSIISSLLELQKDGVADEVKEMLSESQLRIKSIAKVHEKLYKSKNLADTSLDIYISELVEEIENTYTSDKQSIDIQHDIIPVSVSINEAIPIGLMLNELINNAFKHSFKGKETGRLIISASEVNNQIQMEIKSDGNKMDENLDFSQHDSLGMTLIDLLVKRINGTIEMEQDDIWTRFTIRFSLADDHS